MTSARAFSAEYLAELRESLAHGRYARQAELDHIAEQLRDAKSRIRPNDKDELLPLLDAFGNRLGTQVPRWICHVLALRHGCTHILLVWCSPTLGNTLVLQLRDWTKDDSPGRVDMSVGGHITAGDADSETAAFAEMLQETGLTHDDLDGPLTPLGGYSFDESRPADNFFNSEWREVYVGHVKQNRMGAIKFRDGEVAGILLIPQDEAQGLLQQKAVPLASALTASLPRCLTQRREWQRSG
jgi:hypothetical protein